MRERHLTDTQLAFRRIAWDGLAFPVPTDWDLAAYQSHAAGGLLRLEDDTALRLELEWTRLKVAVDQAQLRERYAKMMEPVTKAALEVQTLAVHPDWSTVLYRLPDGQAMATAWRLFPESRLFCLFRLYPDTPDPAQAIRLHTALTNGFELHETGPVPWEFYDLHFTVPRELKLQHTAFQAGRKLMLFTWQRRRLFLWHISLADMILKKSSVGEWCVRFLDGQKEFAGVRFAADANTGAIHCRRSPWHPLGRGEEIARWCFRYRAVWQHLPERNQFILAVFHFRRETDLEVMQTPELVLDLPLTAKLP